MFKTLSIISKCNKSPIERSGRAIIPPCIKYPSDFPLHTSNLYHVQSCQDTSTYSFSSIFVSHLNFAHWIQNEKFCMQTTADSRKHLSAAYRSFSFKKLFKEKVAKVVMKKQAERDLNRRYIWKYKSPDFLGIFTIPSLHSRSPPEVKIVECFWQVPKGLINLREFIQWKTSTSQVLFHLPFK